MSQEPNRGYPVLAKGDKVHVQGIVWDTVYDTIPGWTETILVRRENGRQYTRRLSAETAFTIVD